MCRSAAVVFLAVLTACSFTMARQPPARPIEEPPSCTDSVVPPVLDGTAAVSGAALSIVAIAAMAQSGGCNTDSTVGTGPDCIITIPMAVGGGLAAAGFAYSAREGYDRVVTCRAAYDAHDGYVATRHQAPTPRRHGPYAKLVGGALGIAAGVALLYGVALIAWVSSGGS